MISLKGLLLPRIIGGDLMDEIPVHLAFDWCVVALYSLILQGDQVLTVGALSTL